MGLQLKLSLLEKNSNRVILQDNLKYLLSYEYVKRIIDILFAVVALFLFFPLFIICFFTIKKGSSGPFIFIDQRIGKDGKPFYLYKIRTMYEGSGRGFVTDNDLRVTSHGKILRRTSIDELPQLINVVKGDMSLVGPRPDLEKNYKDYDDHVKKRLKVRPGITGLAQVKGRNIIPWEKRYHYDLFYVNNISFSLDIKIIKETVKVVILRKGINIEDPASLS